MSALPLPVITLLGLALGVLVNALADRLPRFRRVGPPQCPVCDAPRAAIAWSGTLAWLSGKRQCDYCGAQLGLRHPLVEIGAALWLTWLYTLDPSPARFWPALLISMTFLLILVTDFEHRLILHSVTGTAAVLIGVIGVLDPARGPAKTLLGGAVGFVAVLGLYLLGGVFARQMSRLRGQALEEVAFGFGDVTLAGVIGLAVGWPGVIVALFLGILAGGLFSLGFLAYMLVRRRYQAFIPIPYSPFLILGALLVYLGGRSVLLDLITR